MKSENASKFSAKVTAATDYSGEHKAWQQRIEKEMSSSNQKYIQQYVNPPLSQGIENPYIYHQSVHDNAFNYYEPGQCNPNSLKQRLFKHHYRRAFKPAKSNMRSISNDEEGQDNMSNGKLKESRESSEKKHRNKSVLLEKSSKGQPDEQIEASNVKYENKNQSNYTFGGQKNIRGNKIEEFVKKESDFKKQQRLKDNSMIPGDLKQQLQKIGSTAISKRQCSQQHSPRSVSTKKYCSEQRYIEAKNEIPRFNEDLNLSQRPKSIFSGMRKSHHHVITERKDNSEGESYINGSEKQAYAFNAAPDYQVSLGRPQTCFSGRRSQINLKQKSVTSKASKAGSVMSKRVEYKLHKLIETLSKMDESEIDKLSKQLKVQDNPSKQFLTEENLEKFKDYQSDFRSLTEKLNSIKQRDDISNFQSAIDEEDIVSSVVSTTNKTGSYKSVGASYFSYLTNVEKQLKEEKDARLKLEEEINKLKRKNDELSEFIKCKSSYSQSQYHKQS